MNQNGHKIVEHILSECLGKETKRPISTLDTGVVTGAKKINKEYHSDTNDSFMKDVKIHDDLVNSEKNYTDDKAVKF